MTDREHRGTTSSESDKSGAAAATPATLLEMRHLTSDPHLQQRDLPLDSMRMWAMSFAPMMFHRTPEQIEQSDADTYNLVLLRAGTMRRVDATSEMTYGPGDMHVNDSSLPFQLEAHGCHMVSCIGVEVPKRLLPLPNDRVASLVGRKLSAREGMGGLLATVLDHLITGHGSYRSTDAPRLAVGWCSGRHSRACSRARCRTRNSTSPRRRIAGTSCFGCGCSSTNTCPTPSSVPA